MNSEKYIGLDVHQATISVAVMDCRGKVVMESILETKAATLLEFLAGLRGTLSVTFEEGTWAAWLYDLLKPHVQKLVVCNPRKTALLKDGNKNDRTHAARTGSELPDPGQRSDASHESPEGDVSQLGDSLCRTGRLLHPSSRRVAEQDPRGRRAPSGRTPLPAAVFHRLLLTSIILRLSAPEA